jgi:hypothetical protein
MPASSPTSVQAIYDRWTIVEFRTLGDGCVDLGQARPIRYADYDQETGDPIGDPIEHDPPIRVVVRLVKYRVRPDGASERSPHPGDVRQIQIDDLYAEAATDQGLAEALGALTAAVAGRAAAQGAL